MKYVSMMSLICLGSIFVLGHEYTNIVFSPASPASLEWEEDVTITFDYTTDAPNGFRVGLYVISSTTPTLDDGNSGSQLYMGPSGNAEIAFTIHSGEVVVDSVVLLMYDEVTQEIIYQKTVDNISFSFPKQPGGDEAPYPHCTDLRMVPHLTRIGAPFETTIIVENFSDTAQSYQFTPYGSDGSLRTPYSGNLSAGETQYLDPVDLFGSNSAAWFSINKEARVLVTVAFISTGNGSPAFSNERCVFSKEASFLPGNWSNVFDGLAIINVSDQATDVELAQYDQNNQLIHSQTIASGLASMAKTLYVLDTDFSSPSHTRFVIKADQNIAILALSGSIPGAPVNLLWENTVFLH